jgi:hypothetical protein
MRRELATLMQHLKATNARLDQSLKNIEEELLQIRTTGAVESRSGDT